MSELYSLIRSLPTEQRNPNTATIDEMSIEEALNAMNVEDKTVAFAVEKEIPYIKKAIEKVVTSFRNGGRLLYVGAGTSGRLGIVDASECPPTFGSDPMMVQGIIAGGTSAIFQAVEGAEDSFELGQLAMIDLNVTHNDTICGIAASGRTPFVLGALEEASSRGATTIFITTSTREAIAPLGMTLDVIIAPYVGPEVVAGSTRLKSGTAQKMVLNMLTTISMIQIGKTYGNVMVDLQLSNQKLIERAKNILVTLGGVSYDEAGNYLTSANNHVKTALVMILANVDAATASGALTASQGKIKVAISQLQLTK
ncbi:MAG: N-acetylmuramic acid 6-phosphate etherase [Candidatus Kapabacteria bacterium]|nr:N-acetylmuramic acid 6-phosphate etherase [Candidatus Kapabacteria bacterium]